MSDKVITQNFGFLDMIEVGDLVLAVVDLILKMSYLSGEQSLRFLLLRKEKSSYLQERLKSPEPDSSCTDSCMWNVSLDK